MDSMQYYTIIILSSCFILLSFSIYLYIILKHKSILRHQTFLKSIVDIFSHIPETRTSPILHIIAGISLISGISFLFTTILTDIFYKSNFYENILPIVSLSIAIVFSGISFWTLWQTRRIDFKRGFEIFDFLDLINHINVEVDELLDSYISGSYKAEKHHRVYLVTTQPLFGSITYITNKATEHFKRNLMSLIEKSLEENLPDNDSTALEFGLICGDTNAIKEFHTGIDPQRAKKLNNEISNILVKAIGKNVWRLNTVPPVQFMVIGNKVYEFTLDRADFGSSVYNTHVISDYKYAEQYIKTFEIFKNFALLSAKSNIGNNLTISKDGKKYK